MRGKFNRKKTQQKTARSFFLSHTGNLNQQKQRDVVSKSSAHIYPSNKYDFFPVNLLLTNHKALYIVYIILC